MQIQERTLFKRFDLNLALVVLSLNIIGLINVFSATHGQNIESLSRTFIAQVIWFVLGWILYLCISFIDYKYIKKIAFAFWGFNLAMLVLVIFKGV